MDKIFKSLVTKFLGKEVKKMKKLMIIVTAAAFALSTTPGIAESGFASDVTRVLSAEADLSSMADLRTMPMPLLRLATTNAVKPDVAGTASVDESKLITWTYDASKTWKTANEYIQVSYEANLAGWGVQFYTDNTSGSARPRWRERPADTENLRVDKPAGLVGNNEVNYMSIPVAWKAFPSKTDGSGSAVYPAYTATVNENTDYTTNYKEPQERAVGDPASANYYIDLYQARAGSGPTERFYGKYCWLKDKGSQRWNDKFYPTGDDRRDNNRVDRDEIVSDFTDGDDYITVVNYLGSSTCTYDTSAAFIYRDTTPSPIYIVLAAKIAAGTIKAKYSTTTLTLELYHE